MVSQKQLTANRLNCRRSCGPKTAAGKSASRANATKHGLLAKLPTLAALGETPEAWTSHRQAVLDDLGPVGAVQVAVAERIALLTLRLARSARADTAAAAVAFLPAAAVETPPADPTAPDPRAHGVKDLRKQLAAARDRAAAHRRAVDLAGRLDDAPDDEAIDAGMAEALWAAALRALNQDPSFWGEHFAREVLQQEGVTGSDLAPEQLFRGWSVGRLRAGLAHLAEGKGPVAVLNTAVGNWLPHLAGEQDRQVREFEAAVAVEEGTGVAARVGPALETAVTGAAALELIARYEGIQSRELARTLTLYFALRAAMPARSPGGRDGETAG